MIRRTLKGLGIAFITLLAVMFICIKPAEALSNLGPDPNDIIPQVPSGTFAYAISSADHEFAAIPSTRAFLYFQNNTGNKSVVIIGGDTCTDRQNSALNATGGNYWDRPYRPAPPNFPTPPTATWGQAGNPASIYGGFGQDSSYFSVGADTVTGVFSDSDTCYRDERTLTFPGSALTFDPNTGLYRGVFIANMALGTSNAQNHFQLRVTDPTAVVGYDAGLSENSSSLLRYNRDPAQVTDGYSDYLLPFAPDCSVGTTQLASGYWYDDDNDSPATQPERLWMQLLKYRVSDGAYIGPVPLAFSDVNGAPPGPTIQAGPVATSYYVTSGSKNNVRMQFTAESGYKYIWRWNHVFHRNVIQFRLPYDSIYFLTGCKAPSATLAPSSSVDKNKITYPEDATFTHHLNVSQFTANGTVNYSIQRTRNGAAVGAPQTGNFAFNGNGQYVIRNNVFSSTVADAGARVCESITLTSPAGETLTFTGNPSSPACTVVTNRPYFKVTGGDISAGAGMSINGNECTTAGGIAPKPDASLVSWNRGAANGYAGAGTTHGGLTLGLLQSFATGQGSAYAPSGLAFANVGGGPGQIDAAQQIYGGKFGGVNCTPDFWKNANNVIQGDTVINARAIANGTREVMYVNGKVTLTGNITFSGNYASVADIPSFTIVARGNIYIERQVTQLDGFYISEPTSAADNNGMVKTCAQFWFTPVGLDRNLQDLCNTPLTINGGAIGRQIWLLRTAGTLSGSAAETFNYSPEFWVTAPSGIGLNPVNDNGYDAITSLPPVL